MWSVVPSSPPAVPISVPGSEPMARLLGQEINVANLIAYLAELDCAPLAAALGLEGGRQLRLEAEKGRGRTGRPDAMLRNGDTVVAVLEFKVGAHQHSDQFARYDAWARQHGNVPCFLISLDRDVDDAPGTWQFVLLPELLGYWAASEAQPARLLASVMKDTLNDILGQADGPLGRAGRTAVAVAFRQLGHRLKEVLGGDCVSPGRTSGGQPSLLAYLRYPHAPRSSTGSAAEREWLCVDLRSDVRLAKPWNLRVGIEVAPARNDGSPATAEQYAAAQLRAHQLAMASGDALHTSRLAAHLREADLGALADALTSHHDGVKPHSDSADLDNWGAAAAAGHFVRSGAVTRHPRFHHDKGLRLASSSWLDKDAVTVDQLARAVEVLLRGVAADIARHRGALAG